MSSSSSTPSSWEKLALLFLFLTTVINRRGGGGGGGGGACGDGRASAAVPSRHRVSQHPEPGVQVLGGDVVLAVHAVGKAASGPASGWAPGRGSFGGPSWISSRAVTFPSTVLRVRLAFPPDPHSRLKVEYNWFSSPVLEWIIVLNIS